MRAVGECFLFIAHAESLGCLQQQPPDQSRCALTRITVPSRRGSAPPSWHLSPDQSPPPAPSQCSPGSIRASLTQSSMAQLAQGILRVDAERRLHERLAAFAFSLPPACVTDSRGASMACCSGMPWSIRLSVTLSTELMMAAPPGEP